MFYADMRLYDACCYRTGLYFTCWERSEQKGTGNSHHNWVQSSSSEWVRMELVARARGWEFFRVPLKHHGLPLWSCQPSGTPLLSRSLCRADVQICIGSYSDASLAPKAVLFPFVFLSCGNPADLGENSPGARSYLLHKHTQPHSSPLDSSASRKST